MLMFKKDIQRKAADWTNQSQEQKKKETANNRMTFSTETANVREKRQKSSLKWEHICMDDFMKIINTQTSLLQ